VPTLPIDLSGRQVRAALEHAGFGFRRQKGSHMILRRDDPLPALLCRTTGKSEPVPCIGSSPTRGWPSTNPGGLLGR